MSRSEENLATTILSAVLGVICIILIIVVGVLVRIYRVTRTDMKKRLELPLYPIYNHGVINSYFESACFF